jgi:uncharacterized integral membrane protein
MLTILLALLLSIGFTLIAVQNTDLVRLQLGGFIFENTPLYLILLGSLAFGIFTAFLFSMVNALSSALALRRKDTRINQIKKHETDLAQKVRMLELENAKLKERLEDSNTIPEPQHGVKSIMHPA